jgi:ParB/RepB/Spo0J family partition protein
MSPILNVVKLPEVFMTALTKTGGYLASGKTMLLDPRTIKVVEGFNPRSTTWGDENDRALERYIKQNGTLQLPPLTVRHINDSFVLVDGWRRLTATMKNIEKGMAIVSISAVLDEGNDLDAVYRAVNNNAGKPLTELEEAEAFLRAINMGATPTDVVKKTGKSAQYVSQRLTLAKGDPEVLQMVAKKELSINSALAAIRQSNGSNVVQKQLAIRAVANKAVAKVQAVERGAVIAQVEQEEKIEFTSDEKKMFTLLDAHGVDGCLAMMAKIVEARISTTENKNAARKWEAAKLALETAMAM